MMDTMTVFDALEYGAVVWADPVAELAVTWNGGATFNVWRVDGAEWVNVDAWQDGAVLAGLDITLPQAQARAFEYMAGALDGGDL